MTITRKPNKGDINVSTWVGTMGRMVRFSTDNGYVFIGALAPGMGAPEKIETYRVDPSGLETWAGYADEDTLERLAPLMVKAYWDSRPQDQSPR